jgi:hypothetical protein
MCLRRRVKWWFKLVCMPINQVCLLIVEDITKRSGAEKHTLALGRGDGDGNGGDGLIGEPPGSKGARRLEGRSAWLFVVLGELAANKVV